MSVTGMSRSACRCVLALLLVAAPMQPSARVILEVDATRMSLWASRAHAWLLSSACTEPGLMASDVCGDMARIPRSDIRVYAAGPAAPAEEFLVTLVGPEGGKVLGPYDAVVVLDPYPRATFGHLVLLFFVALSTTEERCRQLQGIYIENGDCVQPAREPRCSPSASASPGPGSSSSSGNTSGASGAPCQLLFPPLVTAAGRAPSQLHDRLQCRTDIAGFAVTLCPDLRPKHQVSQLRCDPVATNTKRCDTTQFIKTRCPFMQTCDHAVLVSGGWNRQLSDYPSLYNVLDFHGMLKQNGFHEDNIKIFFANGMIPEKDEDGEELGSSLPPMFPSAIKLALRYRVRRLCETARCADTLLLYLNGPALPGGGTLLWDADNNGQLDETEVYSARELLRDVSGCGARRVIIVADQSFAGDLVRHAAQLHTAARARQGQGQGGLRNVAVLAAGPSRLSAANPWTESGSYTKLWTSPRHRHGCLADLLQEGAGHESAFLGSRALLNVTVTGVPCSALHSLRPQDVHQLRELRQRHHGCQNLSTREWMAAQDALDSAQSDVLDQDDADGYEDGAGEEGSIGASDNATRN